MRGRFAARVQEVQKIQRGRYRRLRTRLRREGSEGVRQFGVYSIVR